MEETIATVCGAVNVLYTGGAQTAEAQEFLTRFQESDESWTICDQIIGRHTDSLACYFAAQTLRSKILKRFRQLPPESYEALRQSLLQHLDRHGGHAHDQQSEATATQLCLAIADLYIQVTTWHNWILELLTQCQSLQGDRTIMTLTLLRVFPEEVAEMRGIGENRRRIVREELANCEKQIMSFLSHVLEKYHNDNGMLNRVLKCLESNLTNPCMSTDSFAEGYLINTVFHILSADTNLPSTVHESATNVVVAALYRAEDVETHKKLAKVLQKSIITLLPSAFKRAEEQEDYDKLLNFTRIFVEMCESFYIQVVNEPSTDFSAVGNIACLELLLLIASHHDYSLIEMTFNVWYRISEELFKFENDEDLQKFRPYAEKFIMALYEHSKFEPDSGAEWPDEKSEFVEFRAKVVEAVRDVVFLVSTDNCLAMMHAVLQETAKKVDAPWEQFEAALFIMACCVQNLLPESEEPVMPEVIGSIVSLPANSPPALVLTSFTLLADANDWLATHTPILPPILKWILQFTQDPRFAPYASSCLESIASKCAPEMTSILDQLMLIIKTLESMTTNGLKAEEAANSIIRACSYIIKNLPSHQIKIGMEKLCDPIVTYLKKTTELTTPDGLHTIDQINHHNNNYQNGTAAHEANKENESNSHRNGEPWTAIAVRPMVWIDRVASVFKDIWKPEDSNPVLWIDTAEKLFHALIEATKKFQSNLRMVEHSIRSIRSMFRALGPSSVVFVEPVVHMLMEVYPQHRHSCLLYMASIVVDEYGVEDRMRPGLLLMLKALTTAAFEMLNLPNGCINNPDTVDDLFRLAQRFTSRAPSVFFIDNVSSHLFALAVTNLQLNHNDANRSVSRFILEVLEQLFRAKKVQYSDPGVVAAQHLIANQGSQLIVSALNASVFHLSGSLQRDMAEIVHMIGRLDKDKQKEWLISAVACLPNDPVKATPQQLQKFVEDVVADCKSQYIKPSHSENMANREKDDDDDKEKGKKILKKNSREVVEENEKSVCRVAATTPKKAKTGSDEIGIAEKATSKKPPPKLTMTERELATNTMKGKNSEKSVKKPVIPANMLAKKEEDFTTLEKKLREFEFYHGFIPREDLVSMLKEKGDYLLRVSEIDEGPNKVRREVILSVIPNSSTKDTKEDTKDGENPENAEKKNNVRNVIVRRYCNFFFIETAKPYDNMKDLISYYKKNTGTVNSFVFTLKNPITLQSWEFLHSDVTIGAVLGAGAFGEVRSGQLKLKDGTVVDVAVKVTKGQGFLTKAKIREMMNEARFIRNFNHKNVVRLYGVAHDEQPLYILLELVRGGSLKDHLTKNKGNLTTMDKIKFSLGAAKGLEYLHGNKVIHRDMAARNCLLDEKVVKITDFGLSRLGPMYKPKGSCKLPTRWLSPEVIATLQFTYASDVYSWGITCYEIFSEGAEPFEGMTNPEVRASIQSSKFLQMPQNCPDKIKSVIATKVFVEVTKRGTMADVVKDIIDYIEDVRLILKYSKMPLSLE
ncbi:unnamed protein product [Caenorhabditis bovis]|uniref:non-specific protein-tyrosine kinase n=1 Tax=Caenorhabditis bovis TaxID=2654633 RepID=A0A8S1EX50_9PELO|nr:unnamed protein product [Caenorhabditis bovis]